MKLIRICQIPLNTVIMETIKVKTRATGTFDSLEQASVSIHPSAAIHHASPVMLKANGVHYHFNVREASHVLNNNTMRNYIVVLHASSSIKRGTTFIAIS